MMTLQMLCRKVISEWPTYHRRIDLLVELKVRNQICKEIELTVALF